MFMLSSHAHSLLGWSGLIERTVPFGRTKYWNFTSWKAEGAVTVRTMMYEETKSEKISTIARR